MNKVERLDLCCILDNIKQVSAKSYSKSTPNIDTAWQSSLSYSKPSFLQEVRADSDGVDISDEDVSAHADLDPDVNLADDDSCGLSGNIRC